MELAGVAGALFGLAPGCAIPKCSFSSAAAVWGVIPSALAALIGLLVWTGIGAILVVTGASEFTKWFDRMVKFRRDD